MNKKQFAALWLGVIIEVVILIYPPWVRQAGPSGTFRYARTWMCLWHGAQSEMPPAGPPPPPIDPELEKKLGWSPEQKKSWAEFMAGPPPEPVPVSDLVEHSRVIDVPVLCVETIVVAMAFAALIFSLKDRSRTTGGIVSPMDLHEFVAKTLIGIVEGVVDAQRQLAPLGAHVVPDLAGARVAGDANGIFDRGGRLTRMVKFDVALTSQTKKGKGGDVTVYFASVGGGAFGRSSTSHEAVNKIQFEIPVAFPMQVETQAIAQRPAQAGAPADVGAPPLPGDQGR